MAEAAGARLADPEVEARLARLDDLLEGLESAPGPTTRSATEAVALLTEVYGEALARVMDHADGTLAGNLAGDELLGHLLVLHDIHPEPAERRAARAVERLRPAVQERGGDVEWAGVEGRVGRVRLTSGGGCGSGCGGGGSEVTDAVRAAVLAVAPELTAVEPLPSTPAPAFVPLTTLTTRDAR
ncbi:MULTISPECIES: NifU family protein [Streptomyces]|uniref:NifU family protein n=1 Tax=Streptomyces koelreuteriae TaxID=2838015 RepID=A0ABX8G395_9ACTN|nr:MULTISPECIES: NifU family protein [Streptomyces]QWB27632.1 NifU family protein [Streptomyces koelreuteriae]UUA10727.1 NifU family protein [Streptomyces koelreuteriae]UUA18334.1 NifU family protein [Streptomyces sp. CRCS-T-1]